MPALLFGSISTLSDTSEIQRGAFNEAFAQHGLDWKWERDDYREQLTGNGGRERVQAYAEQAGVEVDADAIHATKSTIFQAQLGTSPIGPRPGVTEVIDAARAAGWRIGLVTTTSSENVDALLGALDPAVSRGDFEIITDLSDVTTAKPDPAAYLYALEQLGIDPADAIAIEDNVGGVAAAQKAGIPAVAFPNENTVLHDFGETPVTRRLDLAELDHVRTGA